jgi:intracellular sulfur oxidation DsrE/DsrF family protein
MKQSTINPNKHRREFLGTLAAGAAALGLSALATPLHLDANPLSPPSEAAELEAWFDKINGKHRMVFDATHPHEIFPFAWPKVFLMTNEKTGTPNAECNAMIVLRHSAIAYAFEDRLWATYKFGEVFEANDPLTKAPALRNPFWKPKPGDFKVPGVGNVAIGINELQDVGVMFCVCELAMTVYSNVVGEKLKKDPIEIRNDWMAGLLPGIKPVPSGVWALGRAQERGCAYCFTG